MRSASAVASFVDFCVKHKITSPPDKIVKNLCTFLCQDTEQTPTFAYTNKLTDGILSFQGASKTSSHSGDKKKLEIPKSDDVVKTHLSRRGARFAFEKLSRMFEAQLFDVIPNIWQSVVGGLLSSCVIGMDPA